jgi:hypothetical protein
MTLQYISKRSDSKNKHELTTRKHAKEIPPWEFDRWQQKLTSFWPAYQVPCLLTLGEEWALFARGEQKVQ